MSKRAAIIQLHRAGHSNSKIMKLLKAPKSTVCDTILRFQELGTRTTSICSHSSEDQGPQGENSEEPQTILEENG